ncbi:sulfotransferase [Ideonella azotifigens]|uniref:Tetratricopeptide repeat protein n=1 Tax=Ideonella azotifigens TaxID=513160 RepID=A0ABN1JMZ7_9BURK|nr:sulfotransferase [Ideonella azotifigens]MCD2339868.1 sulfotransferase [Ideonella azotifigens]
MLTDDALRQQAEQHATEGRWAQATACFETLLSRHPGDADLLLQLSYMASLAGHYRQARTHTLAAAEAAPTDPELVQELIARLRTFNEAPALLACLERLKPLARLPMPLLLGFAGQLTHLNEHAATLPLLDEAKRREPDHPAVLVTRGQVLLYLGRFDEARAELLACTLRAPQLARAWGLLAELDKQTAASNHVIAIRTELARPNRRPEEVAELAYALHKTLDDLGEHDAAWSALERACRAKRSQLNYRSQDSVDLVDALIAMPAPAVTPVDQPVPDAGAKLPLFIVGMHRSGTTLLEQMLDGHSEVRALGELYDFTSQMRHATDHHCRGVIDLALVRRSRGANFAAVGRGYLERMAWRLGSERFFTDKLPSNFLNIGFICRALPQARILHLRRDPMEVCFSNLRELFHDANPYSYDLRELAAFYAQYQRLMAHWHAQFPGHILDVDYAELVGQPEATLRKVAAFCGLDFEPAMLAIGERTRLVSTASAVSVRQVITKRETPKWQPYADKLRPLAAALAEAKAL